VLAAFEALRPRLPVSAQAVRTGLALVDLPGRFQIVPGQPTLVLDVAHNPQSVAALALNLDQMGFFPGTHAIFGAMRDKDVAQLMLRMAPLVDHWHFCSLATARAANAAELAALWAGTGPANPKASVDCHESASAGLRAAMEAADPADRIVVFGSFYTVGGVLKDGLPQRKAPHVG
jgi:dihydrofolate synthase/folylpolyglutamate synthase